MVAQIPEGKVFLKSVPSLIAAPTKSAGALAAILLYSILFPRTQPLSTGDVRQVINQTLASATPPPAYSALVYQAVRPSLVLIETHSSDESGLGSGVVVDDAGDILTSLHVVANATDIKVTFADGTASNARMTASQPENDIAVVSADNPPAQLVPAVLGNPDAMRVGDDAFVV